MLTNCALKRPDEVADLAGARLGVLAARTEVQERSGLVVETGDDVLAGLGLYAYFLWRNQLWLVFTAPFDGAL